MRLLTTAVLASTLAFAQPPDSLESHDGIRNYYRLRDDIATAGQPTDEALADIQRAGYKVILNLRTPEEGSLEERPKVEALGMEYVNIPVGSDGLTPENLELFAEIVGDTAKRPLFIHCASSNRVGAFWFIHQVLDKDVDRGTALEEARKAGLTSMEPRAVAYVERHKTDK